MARNILHLKPDTLLRNYWHDNRRFADLFNAALFKGRQVIKPDELEDLDTDESSVIEHRNYAESMEASRDNIKIRKKSCWIKASRIKQLKIKSYNTVRNIIQTVL